MSKKSAIWLEVIQTVSKVESELSQVLQMRFGVGLSEYRALEILTHSRNYELRIQELTARLGLNQSSVSRMVERLERQGLAMRDHCSNDKRGIYAVVTSKGRDLIANSLPDYEGALKEALARHGAEKLLLRD